MAETYTLATFREMLRRSFLNDVAAGKWDNDAVLDVICLSMDTLCSHTALPSVSTIEDGATKDGGGEWDFSEDTVFPIPEDAYPSGEALERTGVVSVVTETGRTTFYDPIFHTRGTDPSFKNGFHVWPDDSLVLGEAPGQGNTLTVRYFAYYSHPENDAPDVALSVPRWSFTALAYLCAAHALSRFGVRSADLRQWVDKDDRGNPEDNPLRAEQEHLFKQYEVEISRYNRQDRTNFFRKMK